MDWSWCLLLRCRRHCRLLGRLHTCQLLRQQLVIQRQLYRNVHRSVVLVLVLSASTTYARTVAAAVVDVVHTRVV
jgi:hypothetical protein